jgi:hypothetical protein
MRYVSDVYNWAAYCLTAPFVSVTWICHDPSCSVIWCAERCMPDSNIHFYDLVRFINLNVYLEFVSSIYLHAAAWLKHYATRWKVTGSIPDEDIGFFNWPIVNRNEDQESSWGHETRTWMFSSSTVFQHPVAMRYNL